ncbi:MAG: phosphatase PAP2 family protein [Cryobacterium sp.]|nr:phosphatase PAP2 family protein [Cryobacterium sp.]
MNKVLAKRSALFIVSALALGSAFVGVAFFFVTTRTGQGIDQSAFNGATLGQRTVAPVTLSLLDAVPIAGIAIALVVAVIVVLFRRNFRVLVVGVIAAALANLLTQIVKNLLLVRPDLGVSGYAVNSLPSGHTTLAASAALVVFLVASPRTRPLIGVIGAIFTAAVGVSTLANQWHRPSDVVAALLLVSFFGCLAGLVLLGWRFSVPEPRRDLWSRALLLLTLPCAGLAVATILVAGLAPVAYIGAAAGITACVLLLTAAANHAFRVIL